eukprot:1421148-Pleurochrysis_carterae.AAC.1
MGTDASTSRDRPGAQRHKWVRGRGWRSTICLKHRAGSLMLNMLRHETPTRYDFRNNVNGDTYLFLLGDTLDTYHDAR